MSVEVLTDSPMWHDCKHGLPAMMCAACKHPYTPPAEPTAEYTFDATFDGQCPECNLPISVGHPVAKMTDGSYRHARCA